MAGVIKNISIGIDQTINCCVKLSDGWGQPDEMLSARAWRLRREHPRLRAFIDAVFFWDDWHCAECYEIERQRKQLPGEYLRTLVNLNKDFQEISHGKHTL